MCRESFLETVEYIARTPDVTFVFTYISKGHLEHPEDQDEPFDFVQMAKSVAAKGEPYISGEPGGFIFSRSQGTVLCKRRVGVCCACVAG